MRKRSLCKNLVKFLQHPAFLKVEVNALALPHPHVRRRPSEKPYDMQSVGYREAALKIRLLWLLRLINVAVRIVSCTEVMRGDRTLRRRCTPPMTIDDAVFNEYTASLLYGSLI